MVPWKEGEFNFSSGSTRSISLSFPHSAWQLLYRIRFRGATFGIKNGEELKKGVPAFQRLGRRQLLLAELSILCHKEMILGTVKHALQWHMWKGYYSGHAKTASLSPVITHVKQEERHSTGTWGDIHITSKPWKPQTNTVQVPPEAAPLQEKADFPPRRAGNEVSPCSQKEEHPFCWKTDAWALSGACKQLSAEVLSLCLDWQQKWPWLTAELLLMLFMNYIFEV